MSVWGGHRNAALVFLGIGLLVGVPLFVRAAQIFGGERYELRRGEALSGNLYVGSGSITIEGDVSGDLVAAGGSVLIAGTVSGDVTVAGGDVTIMGNVGGDVRIAGGNVTIGGSINGEVAAAGGRMRLLSSSRIGGILLFEMISLIPFIGWIVTLLFLCAALAALSRVFYARLAALR